MANKLTSKRQAVMRPIVEKHEEAIKEITNLRRKIAVQISELQAEDKKLVETQNKLLKIRDAELEEARQKARK